ncbi:MAG: type II secretion system F family protein [Planctomycetota bacterium]
MPDSLHTGAPASAKKLAGLCERVALSLDSGIDVRRAWRSEATRNRGRLAQACDDVAQAIERGAGLDEAVADAGPVFPLLFVELVRVGEQTGTTPAIFSRLAKHYQTRVSRVREFRAAITWPLLQLGIALLVVGLMIAIGGVLNDGQGRPIDFLGLGLVGTRGLLIYVNGLVGIALVVGLAWAALRRRPDWGAKLRGIASQLPVIGSAVRSIALARIAWALQLTMNVEMDLRRVGPIVLNASDNERFAGHGPAVAKTVGAGEPFSSAFARTGVFPQPFIDTLEVAEETGQIVETMDRLSKRYEEEAEHAIAVLSLVAAFLIWAMIALLIIGLIFRVFGFYTGVLDDALEGL